MMRYEGTQQLADETACARVRADLKMCLLQSDCCKKVTFRITLCRLDLGGFHEILSVSGEQTSPGVSEPNRRVGSGRVSRPAEHILRVQAVAGEFWDLE